jgi:uncharacterized protein (UPF0216 family)
MPDDPNAPRPPEEYFAGELRVMNAHLPGSQKTLAGLLAESQPYVACRDDTPHLFRREELKLLAGFLDEQEQRLLRLPMLIEVGGGAPGETRLRCLGPVEEKVVARILEMPVACREGVITLYRPQLAKLRDSLETTTQYVFVFREPDGDQTP